MIKKEELQKIAQEARARIEKEKEKEEKNKKKAEQRKKYIDLIVANIEKVMIRDAEKGLYSLTYNFTDIEDFGEVKKRFEPEFKIHELAHYTDDDGSITCTMQISWE